MPSVPHPVVRNDDFIAFSAGCGSWCSTNYLAPLNNTDSFIEAGQYLIDTNEFIYMSLLRDGKSKPYLELINYSTGDVQIETLDSKDFWGAVMLDHLSYLPPNNNGFSYDGSTLTLYFQRENDGEIHDRKFKINYNRKL